VKRKDSECNQYICALPNTYIVGNVKVICIQGSNVRICKPFGEKVKVCQSLGVEITVSYDLQHKITFPLG
jgi:hypothetical protein